MRPRSAPTEARRRKEVALAGLRELELAERQGNCCGVPDVELTWAATAAMLAMQVGSGHGRAAAAGVSDAT